MFKINENFTKLEPSYLFTDIARRVKAYREQHPDADIISMGIGDVTRPLCPAVVEALIKGAREEGTPEGFHGYGPEQGYPRLRELIAEFDYKQRGMDIVPDEIFVGDGAKSDLGNIGDILSVDNLVCVTDPVYPVYVDTNVMAGRAGEKTESGGWSGIEYLPCTEENDFKPLLPQRVPDVIYLCYPNNPTGVALTRSELERWVNYALEHQALILFDSAYEAYITEKDVPHSIFEIPGAKRCAIEFRSFSKTAGFTGLRCGYTVVPMELKGRTTNGEEVSLNKMWNRRQTTKFNGASSLSQRAAEALYTPEGRRQVKENVTYYLGNARLLRESLEKVGYKVVGGVNSPYVWVKAPDGKKSWEFFEELLDKCNLVTTPGVGFGQSGEGYVRMTGFNTRENTLRALERVSKIRR